MIVRGASLSGCRAGVHTVGFSNPDSLITPSIVDFISKYVINLLSLRLDKDNDKAKISCILFTGKLTHNLI